MMTVPQAFDLAREHHAAGRLAEAEALLRQLLTAQPDHAGALHLLGIVAQQTGRPDLAAPCLHRVVTLEPENAAAHCHLGEAWRALGRRAEAANCFRHAIHLQPNYAFAHFKLGNAFAEQQQLAAAVDEYRRALALQPDSVDAHNNLGIALAGLHRFDEAIDAFRGALHFAPNRGELFTNLGIALARNDRLAEALVAHRSAIELQPKCAESWNELGIVLVTQKQFPEAVDSFQRAIDLRPNLAEAHNNLGHAYWSLGQYDRAIPAYRHAIDARPGYAEAYNNLGRTLADHRHFADALSAYRHAIELKPDFPEVHNNLGNLLRDQGRLDQAITAYRHALALRPAYAEAQNNLGAALTSQGRLEEALDVYRRALAFNPGHAGIHSNVLLAIQFAPSLDRDVLQKEFQCWNEKFSARFKHSCTSISIDCPQKHRLRVGYVSPDFRDHVIGRNLLPLFRHHDTQNFEIYCYSAVARPDHLTAEFQRHAAGWRPIADLTDEAVAATIQEDQIDILVDLTQHLFANRLPVFCQRPAPVQVSFAGYPESTGLDAIRYRISDRYLECHTDRNPSPELYLLDSFWCYDPLGVDLTVNHLPALENHAITFGCLNNFFKINETLLALWARVLQRVPSSRLLLLTAFGSHRRDTLEVFRRHGVSPERVEFVTARPRQDYLALYHQLDIVLDSYPYNGHTTSLDALWMGVPIVSLVGDRPISRAGLSQLTNLSLPELATFSEDQYVQTAAQLARDLPRLQDLRTTLRNRLEASVIMDGTRFARGIETAYRIFLCHRCTQTAPLPS